MTPYVRMRQEGRVVAVVRAGSSRSLASESVFVLWTELSLSKVLKRLQAVQTRH